MGEALGAKMVIGGVKNGFESIIRQTLEGKGINFKTALFGAGIAALTAGAFPGAGKLFQKASPFVKKAFSKIVSKKNMENGPKSAVLGSSFGNVDEALGRFIKEFKKVKSGVGGAGKADIVEVKISRSKYPESAKHIEDAIANGASVRPINPSDNRGSGSSIGHKLRPYPNGTNIKYKITDD
ncbi:hypothetical protein LGL08_23100 [Clostridium estertheticum]|uniref:hypothetical protein n=1 Tax=Clostridium estertheticum TaxID=238834 RepID=UPI001CF4E342|nr:hypothetical protein [Clostridium estertheticum]MCB2309438.1 hypothetical protein [Clostridium estertheticum]MCB2347874.1 hypothetical protein [Clostridium estertheticum]MCB2352390.1 hypothetical protein [Clostridium estertheticum]WAG45294.1 hypothetical protein LL127_17465 [Clostridium estertheticum]